MTAAIFLPLLRVGATEIILLVLLIVLLFGAKKIPELMRGMGRGVKEFKDAVNKDYTADDNAKEADQKKIEEK